MQLWGITRLAIEVVLSAVYVRDVFPKLKAGGPRLLASLPIIAVNISIPYYFDRSEQFIRRGCCLLILTWLSNFKTLGFAINRGPLCQPLTPFQFLLVYALPITPQSSGTLQRAKKSNNRLNQSAGSNRSLALKFAIKLLMLSGCVYVMAFYQLPLVVDEVTKAFCLYWFLGVMMDGTAAGLGWLAGITVSPHFDAPYLSSSVSEFWSKRWNLTVGNSLRLLVYDPINEGRLVHVDALYEYSKLRSMVAVCGTFVVSGVMHEAIIWHLERRAMTGQWLAFFAVQGPLVAVEAQLLRWARMQGIRAPPWISIPLTLSVLLLVGHWLFFPPAVNSGLADRFFSSMQGMFRFVLGQWESGHL